MQVILFDDHRKGLLPLTYTRPCADLRVGITTIKEKWDLLLQTDASFQTEIYLENVFPNHASKDNLFINGCLLPNEYLLKQIEDLGDEEALLTGEQILAVRTANSDYQEVMSSVKITEYLGDYKMITKAHDIFYLNDEILRYDFEVLTKGRSSAKISDTNLILGTQVFVEEGAKIEGVSLNSTTGPIYIGKDAEIMEGSLIRGPFACLDHSVVKMGAKIYGATTIGPWCKVGGEINNAVFQAYSNKGHDGFLGNAVIGEWCNLGADTNSSNLKNNYAEVKVWDYHTHRFTNTGLQFCGLIMGDHSKCGINTMFNTGTVVGVSANIFGAGFPRNFIPSFTWGGSTGFSTYAMNKACDTANRVMQRRGKELSDADKMIFKHIFEQSSQFRIWEKKTSTI